MSKTTSTGASSSIIEDFPDDDLKTPTVEELSFPGQKVSLTFHNYLKTHKVNTIPRSLMEHPVFIVYIYGIYVKILKKKN